jgi:hypothetical protein
VNVPLGNNGPNKAENDSDLFHRKTMLTNAKTDKRVTVDRGRRKTIILLENIPWEGVGASAAV